jgi:hypothetical protein
VRARQEWNELQIRTSGRVSEAQWRTLVTDFKMLRLRVGNATEYEATRLALGLTSTQPPRSVTFSYRCKSR